jgi:adenosylcobinamide kinase/adenosylcobinamide-phosphate guanylyltransferase
MRTWRSRARRSLVTLCQTVPPSRLCVETLDYDFGHLEPVIDELGLSVAVDVGHLHRDGAPLRDVLLRNLHRTKVIQWHGTDPTGRDHRSLAFFPRSEARWLVDTLCREAYTGILTIEVFTEHDLEESLDVFREISRERAGKELMERKRILVGGGARSGKSAYALHLAHRLGEQRWFVATAQALDPEMQQRIDRHRAERGSAFTTIEEPVELVAALDGVPGSADVVVVDCLTLWLSNLLLRGETEQDLHVRLETLSAALHRVPFHLIFVSNEVGMGVVPESALGRLFRDVTGRTHQHLVPHMDEIYAAILGTILRLKPGPVAVQSLGSES